MPNPWAIDEEDIPQDPRARSRKQRLRLAGLVLWGLFFGSLTVLLVSDTGGLSTTELFLLGSLSVATATVVMVICAAALVFLQRLPVVGQIVFGFVLLLFLAVVVPPLVSLVIDNAPGFGDILIDSEQPVVELIRQLTERTGPFCNERTRQRFSVPTPLPQA